MQDATIQNQQEQNNENILTTDDLVLMIGEKEVNLFQKNKLINGLRNKLSEIHKVNLVYKNKLDQEEDSLKEIKSLKKVQDKLIEENEALKVQIKLIDSLENENKKLKQDHKIVINKLNKKIENLRTQIHQKDIEIEEETEEKEGPDFEDIVELE
jgi:hypothetical protein